MYFISIDHNTALDWIDTNQSLKNTKHECFSEWKKHLLKTNLSYFYWGEDHWSAAIKDDTIKAIYYYTLARDNIYDGYLISNSIRAGVKLDRWQYKYTKELYNWKLTWTMADTKHIKYNQRLGYRVVSKVVNDHVFMVRR